VIHPNNLKPLCISTACLYFPYGGRLNWKFSNKETTSLQPSGSTQSRRRYDRNGQSTSGRNAVKVYLLDVNVLIALSDPMHVHHESAQRWFAREGRKACAACPLTESA
jgi:hypothetical protein